MKITYGIGILLLIFYINPNYSQSKLHYSVSGKIVDYTNEPMEFVSVGLLNAKDSSIIKGTISDEKGNYKIENLKAGKYLITAIYVGYNKFYSRYFIFDSLHKEIVIDTIKFTQSKNTLKEITVSYIKPLIERKLDKTIINIENSILTAGNTGLEILEKLPGVSVDQNGNVSLNGKGGVQIYIDGKPTNLSSSDLASLLNGMNADMIEKIELISNPSSKYDAAGRGGIINIRLKKNQKIGLNGSANASYGQGFYPRFLGGINMNYRNKKWNLYSNYNHNTTHSYSSYQSNRNFHAISDNSFDQSGRSKTETENNSLRIGTDYFVSRKATIGLLLNGIVNDFNEIATNTTQMKSGSTFVDSSLNNTNINHSKWLSYSGNLNFKYDIDSIGKQVIVDLNYSNYLRTNEQNFQNDYFNSSLQPSHSTTLKNQFPGSLAIYTAKTDLTLPFKNKIIIETGAKISWVKNDNDLQFYRINNNIATLDSNLSNHFIYKENINAAYINISKEFKKISYQVGLRGEQTIASGNQLTTNIHFNKNYFNLFPSAFLNYSPSVKNQFSLSYSRNINRPSYQSLNPYKKIYDPFNYEEGNPLLNPEFGYSSEFAYIFNNKIVFGISYSNSKGGINSVIKQNDSTKTTIITYGNIAKVQGGGITLNITEKLTPWWTTNIFVGEFFNNYEGIYLNQELKIFLPTLNLNASNTFIISENIKAELSINYLGAQQQGLLKIEPIGIQVIPGIQWQFHKKQGSIKLSLKDAFKQRKWNYTTQFQNIDASYKSTWDSRVLTLSLNWKFGKKTVPQERKRATGNEQEKDRVKFEKGNS